MASASTLSSTKKKIIALSAELAESLSISPTLARIYALLYMCPASLSLPEIASLLSMSKGTASISLRTLESWGAVHRKWVLGTRKDHYEAERDLKTIVLKRLEEGLLRRLESASEKLQALNAELNGADPEMRRAIAQIQRQISGFQDTVRTAQKLLKFLPHIDKLSKFLRTEDR
jgi:DNA-binding transcriptional regulator GbsR (MarR family)